MRTLAFVLLGMSLCAQTPENQTTKGLKNGRWWAARDDTARTYYIVGLVDGVYDADANLAFVMEIAHPDVKYFRMADVLFSDGATFLETVKGLDQFYEDPANAAIAIHSALVLFKKKVEGVSPDQLSAEIAAARRASRADDTKPPPPK